MFVNDFYFQTEYGNLCALAEEGEVVSFVCEKEYGKITYLFLKRPIMNGDSFTGCYDIVSPYGYGGPVIRACEEEKKELLLQAYDQEFTKYCEENQIVSEFIRFHPIAQNALDFQSVYQVIYSRKTVGSNLMETEDPVAYECTKSCRKRIRQTLNKGVTYKVTYQPKSLHEFKEIYYATMDRNQATDYYYFSDVYFDALLRDFGDKVLIVEALYENQCIAMNLCIVSEGCIHIHLSGTRDEFLYLSPAYILRYALLEWGKEHNLQYIHHGGGRSGAEDDSLYLFKKQFGVHTEFDFYIGKRIRNESVYEQLCEIMGKSSESDYFPAYRA